MRSDRLISLLLLLQARGRLTAPTVAHELGVSVRTVYRDVDALCTAGVPVWTEQGRGGGIHLMPGYRTDMTGLTAAESRALVAMSGRAVPDDLGMGSALASAVHKLVAAVPASHRDAAEEARKKVLVDHEGWYREAPSAPHLDTVQEAVWSGRRLRLRYRGGSGDEHRYLIDPYGLVAKAGAWYLVGAHRGRARMWRVDRVLSATVEPESACVPTDLDLAAVWSRLRGELERPAGMAPVEVRLRARPDVVATVLRVTAGRRLAPGPDTIPPAPADDGWCHLTMTFRAPKGAMAALIAFGGDVEVLAPAEAREELVTTARAVLRRYVRSDR